MKFRIFASICVVAFFVSATVGCKKSTSSPAPHNVQKPSPKDATKALAKFVKVKIKSPKLIEYGDKVTTSLTWHVQPGFKWNKDFPASLKIMFYEGAEIKRVKFEKKDFVSTKTEAKLSVSYVAKKTGPLKIKAIARISVCNDSLCKIIPNQAVDWTVTVR